MFTKSKILQGIAYRLHCLRLSAEGHEYAKYKVDARNLKEDNASVQSYLSDYKVSDEKAASAYYNETNSRHRIKAEDDQEIIFGWRRHASDWDECYYLGDRKDSPNNMEFSDVEASYWADPSNLLNFTASLADNEICMLNGGEVSSKNCDMKREMIERIASEGANTQAAINEAYRRIEYLLRNEPDSPIAKDAIARYGQAINKLYSIEESCSPYSRIRSLLYNRRSWAKSKGSNADKAYRKVCDELDDYGDPQYCEELGLDYELVQEYIASWEVNQKLEKNVKRQVAEARKANQAQAAKGEKNEKIDN